MGESMLTTLFILVRLPIVLGISYYVGESFQRIRMPAISGFLMTGVISGPFITGMLSESGLDSITFVDKLCLACVAFSAGSEMHLLELRKIFAAVSSITVSITVFSWLFVCTAMMLLANKVSSSARTMRLAYALCASR
jgi:Kef-type K+ transport system membrane component KefB